MHPVFFIPEDWRLILDLEDTDESIASYLGHCITRNPLDLHSHTRLVYLRLRQDDSTALYTALLDLFLALGDKGLSLRKHLLQLCSARLQAHQRTILTGGLKQGLHRNSPLADTGNSLLHKGNESNIPLVNRTTTTQEARQSDPLSEARECLEYGQLDQALELLEPAMLEAPDNTAVRTELLAIYARGNMQDRFQAQTRAMRKAGYTLPLDWTIS
jgi:Tfp pilus assembly protein FimV